MVNSLLRIFPFGRDRYHRPLCQIQCLQLEKTLGADAFPIACDCDVGLELFGFFEKLSCWARVEARWSGDGDILFGGHDYEDDAWIDLERPGEGGDEVGTWRGGKEQVAGRVSREISNR